MSPLNEFNRVGSMRRENAEEQCRDEGVYSYTDRELLGMVQGGNRKAMAIFVMRRERALVHRARRGLGSLCRRVIDPEDVVMDAMIKLDKSVKNCELGASCEAELEAYVWATLDSTLSDLIRKTLRSIQRDTSISRGMRGIDDSPLPGERVDHRAANQRLWKVARCLVNKQDQVLFFLIVRGVPIRDAAVAIGCSAAAASVRWGRIRRKIQSEIRANIGNSNKSA